MSSIFAVSTPKRLKFVLKYVFLFRLAEARATEFRKTSDYSLYVLGLRLIIMGEHTFKTIMGEHRFINSMDGSFFI